MHARMVDGRKDLKARLADTPGCVSLRTSWAPPMGAPRGRPREMGIMEPGHQDEMYFFVRQRNGAPVAPIVYGSNEASAASHKTRQS